MSRPEEREPEGFLEKDRSRKNRKHDRRGDGGKKIHRVGSSNGNWRFDPSLLDEEDSLYGEDLD